MQLPRIIVYRDHLLPASETFIKAQGEGLKNFYPVYVGSRRVNGLTLPTSKTLVVNEGGVLGKFNEYIFKKWGIAPSLYNSVANVKPVLLHAQFGVGGALALPIIKRFNLPSIVTFHGFDATVKDEFARKSFYGHRLYIKRRDCLKDEVKLFIAVSNFIKNKLIEKGFPEERIIVHYIGTDTKYFTPDNLIQRKPVVLFVGRLVENKGCEYLIKAMKRVQVNYPNVELVVIGDGPLRNSLEALARGTLKNYKFLGAQSLETVKYWMNKAKVFCVPSITIESGASEGFGIVFIEAQAMGLPVVSFKTGGISEAVENEESGLLAPERDYEALARNIEILMQNKNLWNQFSTNGQQRVKCLFNLKEQTKQLEKIYESVLGENL